MSNQQVNRANKRKLLTKPSTPVLSALNTNRVSQPETSTRSEVNQVSSSLGDNTNSGFQSTVASVSERPKSNKKSRKKIRNRDNWFDILNKRKRNHGQAFKYKQQGNRKIIKDKDARKVGPPCNCKNKCFEKLGMEAINANLFIIWINGI